MIEHKENWSTKIKCRFCQTEYTATESNILYGDLRPEFFLIPDYQFYISCYACGKNIIVSDIPSRIALKIQQNNG